MRRISRRCRSAASATSRPGSRTPPRVLAEVKGIAPEALAGQTTANFRRLFAQGRVADAA